MTYQELVTQANQDSASTTPVFERDGNYWIENAPEGARAYGLLGEFADRWAVTGADVREYPHAEQA